MTIHEKTKYDPFLPVCFERVMWATMAGCWALCGILFLLAGG